MTRPLLREDCIGSLPWVIVRGSAQEVFEALGSWARSSIADSLEAFLDTGSLESFAASRTGREKVARITDATRRHCEREWYELEALARGANVPLSRLLLFNLRGDLDPTTPLGCSDLAWLEESAIMAHNEDGLPLFDQRSALISLHIDGEPPLFAFWYPGLTPSNAFVVNGAGLVWSMDHLGVRDPPAGAGRHFVSRKAQRAATFTAALATFGSTPSAGGFAYTVGEVGTNNIACFEVAAGRRSRIADVRDEPRRLWHANNMRYLEGIPEKPDIESLARSGRLEDWCNQTARLGASSALDVLAGPTDWPALYRSATSPDPLMTLCSILCNVTTGDLTIAPRGGEPVTMPISSLMH
jgi:hypothetical protein